MPSIILGQKPSSDILFYQSGDSFVNVSEETNYEPSNIFHKFVHKPKNGGSFKTEPIKIYKGIYDFRRCLTLTTGNGYESATLQKVEVYFNKYDEHKTPLLFVLQFKNGPGSVQNRYYKRSDFDSEISRGQTKKISELTKYEKENDILCDLIKENDTILEPITYNIGEKGDRGTKYNEGKIEVTEDLSSDQQLGHNGFKRYKHTPSGSGRGRKACVIYNCNALLKDGKKEVTGIQNQEYESVNVYFGDKAKRTGTGGGSNGGVEDVPLLIELNRKDTSGRAGGGDPEYYVHKQNGEGEGKYYWEKLTGANGDGGNTLKELLEDIGLNTNPAKKGYDKLKEILRGVGLSAGSEQTDLSERLKQAKGSKLHTLLQQKVNGSKTLLVLLLQRIEFNIVDSVVILMDKKDSENYGEGEIQGAITGLDPPGKGDRINRVKNGGNQIQVTDDTGGSGTCIQSYKYKVVQHDFSALVTKDLSKPLQPAGIRFLIPTKDGASNSGGGGKYRELSLYSTGVGVITGPEHLVYKYYTKNDGVGGGLGNDTNKKVYVVFYNGNGSDNNNGDPRPLLLCYGGQAYIPKDKSSYFSDWVKVPDVQKCVCNNGEGDTNNREKEALLGALTKVVGFLNPVDLSQHPGTCEASSSSGSPGRPGPASITCPGENGKSCTYDVHTYKGEKVQIKVCCEPVSSPPGNGPTCYRKLVHTPAGLEGKGDGFRLGDVIHASDKSKLDYTSGATQSDNKYKPLTKVTAYFYNEDTKYQDPLLVELEFKANGGAGSSDNKEYYKLQPASDGGGLQWSKDSSAGEKVKNNGQLVAHLDRIRYEIKKVLKIELQHNTSRQYQAMGRKGSSKNGSFDQPIGNGDGTTGKQIQVEECNSQCTQLTSYKFFRHQLSELGPELDQVGGIALTLPGKPPVSEIVLTLYQDTGGTCNNGDQKIEQLTYNRCMGDVYVFFYDGSSSGGVQPDTTDTVPLMVYYNGNYYKPCDRESYFTKWVCVKDLGTGTSQVPCGDDQGSKLADQLDEVNRALNVIELDKSVTGKGYGLPEGQAGSSFKTERVTVTTKAPTSPYAKNAYTRVVHRTKNGFQIGEIHYGSKEITVGGITPNGGTQAINVAKGTSGNNNHNHTSLVTTNGWNTVVAYYSTTDTQKKLPQLIVILKTDNPIIEGVGTVTGASDKKDYGYYILSNKDSGGSEYVWRPVTGGVTLDDATDFTLLNSLVILVDRQDKNGGGNGTYGDSDIQKAVKAAIKQGMTASPGNSNDVNRLTGKEITIQVNDDSEGATTLSGTGFKLITHNISALVNLNPSLSTQLKGVTLIGGLRFLIPTREQDKYKQLTLKDNGEPSSGGKDLIMYHQSGQNIVNVFFYCEDPRPLLVCFNNSAYKPTNKWNYFSKWYKDEKISKCEAKSPGGDSILKELVEVSNFLNPVNLKKVPSNKEKKICFYNIHWFNGKGIKIKVDFKPSEGKFCYNKYTHTHCGTASCKNNGKVDCETSGKGFRLGNIEYGCNCIKENSSTGPSNGPCITSVLNGESPGKHKSADKVVVFYYKHDTKHENPLMVVLCGREEKKCKPYYTLKEKGKTEYKKNESEINLTNNETLGKKLDEVLFKNNKMLQIILSERPKPIKLCSEDYKENCNDLNCLKGNNCDKQDKELKELQCKLIEKLKDNKTISDSILYHVPDKICYQGQLYTNDGSEVSNGKGKTDIKVTEVKHKDLKDGYRCFKHDLLAVDGIEEVGGLKLYLWKGQSTEIELFEEADSGILEPELLYCEQIVPVTYNTCKGNLYVYFYGEDPRPLMLCYDGNAYRAECKDQYEEKWVCVPKVKCQCGEAGFEATQVLTQLYGLSMFLNEVQLGETKSAYDQFKSEMQEEPRDPSKKVKPYTYEVHEYNKTKVYVMVTGHDLSCYKQYVHKHEKLGYRLGNIKYNGNDSQKTGLKYTSSKQLISVSLYYYMYDKDHDYPLIVELGYKGELSEFYRLNDPGNKGGESGSTEKKWEKMDGVSGSCAPKGQNGEKGPQSPQVPNGKSEEKKNTCELDKEFARTAAELQLQIYKEEIGIPWDHNRYWYRVVDLEELIERRAYRIRKQLEKSNKETFKYTKTDDNLILKTKDNCHEESVMGYVIGGGAVGVVY